MLCHLNMCLCIGFMFITVHILIRCRVLYKISQTADDLSGYADDFLSQFSKLFIASSRKTIDGVGGRGLRIFYDHQLRQPFSYICWSTVPGEGHLSCRGSRI